MFFAVANTFANTFYMQTNGFGKLHWYLNHSHSCGLNRVIRVYHYPVLQVMAERLFQRSLPDHCMNRYLPIGKVTAYNLWWLTASTNVSDCFIQLSKNC